MPARWGRYHILLLTDPPQFFILQASFTPVVEAEGGARRSSPLGQRTPQHEAQQTLPSEVRTLRVARGKQQVLLQILHCY